MDVLWLRSQLQGPGADRNRSTESRYIRNEHRGQLDTAHSTVSFTAKHMMITKTRGISRASPER